MPAIF